MENVTNKLVAQSPVVRLATELLEDVIDLEEYALANRKPPAARRYAIRIDRKKYTVEVPGMTGRELLELAAKVPAERYMITQRFCGGRTKRIGLDEKVDLTTPGVERFMTLPLDQTEG
jgi:hypothetical protein